MIIINEDDVPRVPGIHWCHANTDKNHAFADATNGFGLSATRSLCGAVEHPGEVKCYGVFAYCDGCLGALHGDAA